MQHTSTLAPLPAHGDRPCALRPARRGNVPPRGAHLPGREASGARMVWSRLGRLAAIRALVVVAVAGSIATAVWGVMASPAAAMDIVPRKETPQSEDWKKYFPEFDHNARGDAPSSASDAPALASGERLQVTVTTRNAQVGETVPVVASGTVSARAELAVLVRSGVGACGATVAEERARVDRHADTQDEAPVSMLIDRAGAFSQRFAVTPRGTDPLTICGYLVPTQGSQRQPPRAAAVATIAVAAGGSATEAWQTSFPALAQEIARTLSADTSGAGLQRFAGRHVTWEIGNTRFDGSKAHIELPYQLVHAAENPVHIPVMYVVKDAAGDVRRQQNFVDTEIPRVGSSYTITATMHYSCLIDEIKLDNDPQASMWRHGWVAQVNINNCHLLPVQ